MGVKNLSKILKKFCPQVIKRTTIGDYSNKIIGIDASIFFYKFVYVSNKYDKPNHYLQMFLQQIMTMKTHNITPIYVFDGVAPKAKESEQLKRSESRIQRKDDIASQRVKITQMRQQLPVFKQDVRKYSDLRQEIRDLETKVKNKEDAIIHVTPKHTNNLKGLLTILSIPYIQGNGETDPLTAQLCKDGLFDYVMSEDMDYLPLATPKLIRTERTPYTGAYVEKCNLEYDYADVLTGLGLDTSQFTDLCILCGCDYVDQLYKIGPLTAYKLIKEHRSVENVLQNIDHEKHKVPDNYLELVTNARNCFGKKYTHKITKDMLCTRTPNIEKFEHFMNTFCTISPGDKKTYTDLISK